MFTTLTHKIFLFPIFVFYWRLCWNFVKYAMISMELVFCNNLFLLIYQVFHYMQFTYKFICKLLLNVI